MVYFATAEEQRFVQRGLLPGVRRQRTVEELRGWNWHQPPLKPIYGGEPLGMHEVSGKYCPTGRDVFLRRVQAVHAPANRGMRDGRVLHAEIARLFVAAKRLVYLHGANCVPHLARLAETMDGRDEPAAPDDSLEVAAKVEALRNFEIRRIAERVEGVLAAQPHAEPDALAILAMPVHVEIKLDGRYLGMSGHLAADALAFPEMTVLDLKFGPREPFHRLTTTGYALVLESLYEVPVDVGCVVYVRFVNGRVVVERDYHVIGDELRQTFVEERDDKMRSVSEELDPGLPDRCPGTCPYLPTCRPADGAVGAPDRAVPANLLHRERAAVPASA